MRRNSGLPPAATPATSEPERHLVSQVEAGKLQGQSRLRHQPKDEYASPPEGGKFQAAGVETEAGAPSATADADRLDAGTHKQKP